MQSRLVQIDFSHVFPLDGVPCDDEYIIVMESDSQSPQLLKHSCRLTDGRMRQVGYGR